MVCDTLTKNGWKYIPAEELPRSYSDVLVEPMVKKALIRLNPVIAEYPSRADEEYIFAVAGRNSRGIVYHHHCRRRHKHFRAGHRNDGMRQFTEDNGGQQRKSFR